MARRKEPLSKDQVNAERRDGEISDVQQSCDDWGRVYLALIMFSEYIGLRVREVSMVWYDGLLANNRIGIRKTLPTPEERARNLAHELGHWYLLKDNPCDLVKDPDPDQEELADKVAEAFIDFARFSIEHGAGIPNINEL